MSNSHETRINSDRKRNERSQSPVQYNKTDVYGFQIVI